MKKRLTIIFLGILSLLMVGCQGNIGTQAQDSEKINVVAAIYPQYEFARAVAGDHAQVEMLIKPGVDIHYFEPSPEDIMKIEEADLFIYNGGADDHWADTILDSLDEKPQTLRLLDYVETVDEELKEGMEDVPHAHGHAHDHDHSHDHDHDHDHDHAHDHDHSHDQ